MGREISYKCDICGRRVSAPFMPRDWFEISQYLNKDWKRTYICGLDCLINFAEWKRKVVRNAL